MEHHSGKTCRLLTMLSLTSMFFLTSILVGYITKSTTLVTYSFHRLPDIVALILGLVAVQAAKWPSRKNTFGWVRAEILGALVNVVFLQASSFSMLVASLKRIFVTMEGVAERPDLLAAVASAGLAVSILGLFLFHGLARGHSRDGGSHSQEEGSLNEDVWVKTFTVSSDMQNTVTPNTFLANSSSQMNMKGVFLHVLGDALGSVVVIISSLVIWKAEGQWRFYIDPAMSILVVIMMLFITIPLMKQTSWILLQTTPNFLDQTSLKLKLEEVEGVLGVHEFHVWQLTGNHIVLSAHILCNNLHEYTAIAANVKDLFHREGIHSTTVQPEFVEISEQDFRECQLSCINGNEKCVQDSCCGTTPKTLPKHKICRDRCANTSGRNLPTNS